MNEESHIEENATAEATELQPKDLIQTLAEEVRLFTTKMHNFGIAIKTIQMEDNSGVLELKFKSPKPFVPDVEEDGAPGESQNNDTPDLPGLFDEEEVEWEEEIEEEDDDGFEPEDNEETEATHA